MARTTNTKTTTKVPKKAEQPQKQKGGCATGNCGANCAGGFHDDVCCPEPYRYKYKYNCKAVPCDFKIWKQKTDCPCCPAPYEYQYTVYVTCIPTECVREPLPCPQPAPESSCTEPTTDSFPTTFSASTSSSTVEIRLKRKDRK